MCSSDPSSAQYQSKETGCVDGIGTEDEILDSIRDLVCLLPGNNGMGGLTEECGDDLNRACENLAAMKGDPRYVLSEIADDHVFFETKKDFAKDMVTGFIRLNGTTIGAVANCTEVYDAEGKKTEEFGNVLSARGCSKAAEFVSFCDAFDIPVLSLTNVKGYKAGKCSENNLAKSMAKLTCAFSSASVPKVNVIVGEAFGSAYVTMNSKSIGADMVYAWTDAKIGMMDAELAAKIMYVDADADLVKEKAKEYDQLQSGASAAARRGYVDLIIEPETTRKYLVAAFEMLYTKSVSDSLKKHGTK